MNRLHTSTEEQYRRPITQDLVRGELVRTGGSVAQLYRRIESGNLLAQLHQNWETEFGDLQGLFADLLANPGQIRRGGRGEGTSSLREINGRPYFIKIYTPRSFRRRLREVVGRHRALREWSRTVRAVDAGVRTAMLVLAMAERKGLNSRNLIITSPANGVSVSRIFEGYAESPMDLDELIRLLAAQTVRYHRIGFYHRHLKATHLFLNEERTITCIDLEGSIVRRPLPHRLRVDNLRQMRRSLERYDLTRDRFAPYRQAYEEAWGAPGK